MCHHIKTKPFILALIIFLLFICAATAQEKLKPVPLDYKQGFESINAIDCLNYVNFLAADELEGRDTASKGLRIARNYTASLFALWGLKPAGDMENNTRSFHQYVEMQEHLPGGEYWARVDTPLGRQQFENNEGYNSSLGGGFTGEITGKVVFAGYGITAPENNYDDFEGIDVKGKLVAVMGGVPGGGKPGTPFEGMDWQGKYGFSYKFETLPALLKKKGALGIIYISIGDDGMRIYSGILGEEVAAKPFQLKTNDDYKQGGYIAPPGRNIFVPSLMENADLPSITAWEKMADTMFAPLGKTAVEIKTQIDKNIKPASMDLDCTVTFHASSKIKQLSSGNVLGMIEGSDPELKNEVIVIGAHMDHLGVNNEGYVFNGADDNASGAGGVLELAQAFALNPVKPKRSILFACWTGEEKGLLGSRYFVANPTLDGKKIVANINLDMISRDYELESLRNSKSLLPKGIEINKTNVSRMTGATSSSQSPWLKTVIEEVNRDYVGMILLLKETARSGGNSDYAAFLAEKIPAVAFMAAFHKDYHQPGDSVEKINTMKMEMTLKVIYMAVFTLGNQETPLNWIEE